MELAKLLMVQVTVVVGMATTVVFDETGCFGYLRTFFAALNPPTAMHVPEQVVIIDSHAFFFQMDFDVMTPTEQMYATTTRV